jgi:hypothetical protein
MASPELEIKLCQTLVKLRAPSNSLPLATLIERIIHSEPRIAAAHAMLVTLGGKAFARASEALMTRHRAGPESLHGVLENAYEILTGTQFDIAVQQA